MPDAVREPESAHKSPIYPEDDEAAQLKTLTGWVSRDGYFFGNNEDSARYAGSTHRRCKDCSKPTQGKHWLRCDPCQATYDKQAHFKLPLVEWDGSTPIYSNYADTYFFNDGDLDDFLSDWDGEPGINLQCVICRPQRAYPIELTEMNCDNLADDCGSEMFTAKALMLEELLNEELARMEPLSWYPANKERVLVVTRPHD